ncbi:MAG: ABC transporter ATPase [Parcubacteria group bacterium Gr01-1014_18]|nr:MAG: ABC transporter ATPase [Parcubacteria group bacterium Greene0416_36]TSC80236.1 MAG: ABC transporter ATPase [Parcubacteria group bacterium Gr01-1014_18]TSC98418.1 MAG: ABC transporter ATPase [Parcubacteria group bacterium Greene1014_20]TSD06959.1 MAG: ABC transporter ATPase [Parcubacteria group bacterium Greene0714_2]
MSIIEVKNLSKNYEYYRKEKGIKGSLKSFFYREKLLASAIKDISFSIGEGELVGFLGPNGAGKTTTLKILSGILYPSAGEATVLGFTPSRREATYQKQFSLVMGQKNQLISNLPAMESFIINKEIYGISDSEFKKTLDELVGLFNIGSFLDISVKKLSLGQRMKCELVAALLHKPKVFFLDEPTIGLDVVAQKNIRDFLKTYNEEKKTTIILTSHYMEDIRELCQRVIIINLGVIAYDGRLDDLIKQYVRHKLLTVTFSGKGILRRDIEKFGEIEDFSANSCTIKTSRSDAKSVAVALLSSSLPVDDITIGEESLDDVIRHIFGEGR